VEKEAAMGRINATRLLVAGLAAGFVINVGEFLLNGVILASQLDSLMRRLNVAPPQGAAIGVFLIMGFLLGMAIVWLYAAIRPRYGAGPRTALIAGAAVWALAYAYPSIGMTVMGFFPGNMMLIGVVWGLVELLVAAVVGGALYREEETIRSAVA
jgi:hypothetical protein